MTMENSIEAFFVFFREKDIVSLEFCDDPIEGPEERNATARCLSFAQAVCIASRGQKVVVGVD